MSCLLASRGRFDFTPRDAPEAEKVLPLLEHIGFRIYTQENACKKCGKVFQVPMVELTTSPDVKDPLTAAAKEVLDMHRDESAENVGLLIDLVETLFMLGSWDLPNTLGHPLILRHVIKYAANFACPGCDPWSFGMARACIASVMAKGVLRFDSASLLLQMTQAVMRTLKPVKRKERRLAEAAAHVSSQLTSVNLGMRSSWFDNWKK